MKGPMTTQSCADGNHGPMHWRCDRHAVRLAERQRTSLFHEDIAFKKFTVAFRLARADAPLSARSAAFTDFI